MFLEQDGRPVKYATLLSGGMDSVTMLYDLHPVPQVAISVDYGQLHRREIDSARLFCGRLRIPHVIVAIDGVRGGSLLDGSDEMIGANTVTPCRNGILIMLAANVGVAHGCNRLAIGCNANDREVYLDCRSEYLQAIGKSLEIATGIRLCFPYVNKSKAEIRQIGEKLGVMFTDTWSCYAGGDSPCGMCGACIEVKGASACVS